MVVLFHKLTERLILKCLTIFGDFSYKMNIDSSSRVYKNIITNLC